VSDNSDEIKDRELRPRRLPSGRFFVPVSPLLLFLHFPGMAMTLASQRIGVPTET